MQIQNKGKKQTKYLVSYDITSDKRRRKVVKILEGYGFRVQYSVFECELSGKQFKELSQRLKPLPVPKSNDSIRFYQFCAECRDKLTVVGTDYSKSVGIFKVV